MDKLKVLFLAANPTGTIQLKLDEEIRTITQQIRASQYRDVLELKSAWAVRPDDLLQTLNEYKPQIVHFSGHGSGAGEIILVDRNGAPKSVSARAIKALFTTLKDNIQIVILNACYSRSQAEAIIEVIDCAIGMNDAIGDEAAIVFAASFYRAIGFGRSVQEAFDQGNTALLLEGISEDTIPELLVKAGANPSQLFLVNPSAITHETQIQQQVVGMVNFREAINARDWKQAEKVLQKYPNLPKRRSLLGLSMSNEVQEYFFYQLHPGNSPQVLENLGRPVTPLYYHSICPNSSYSP